MSCLVLLASNGVCASVEKSDSCKDSIAVGNNSFAIDLYRVLIEKGGNVFFSPFSIYNVLTMVVEGTRNGTAAEFGKILHYPESLKSGCSNIPWGLTQLHSSLSKINKEYDFEGQSGIKDRIDELERTYYDSTITKYDLSGDVDTAKYFADIKMKEKRAFKRLEEARDSLPHYEVRLANSVWVQKDFHIHEDYLRTISKYYADGGVFKADFIGNLAQEEHRINAWIEEQTRGRIQGAFQIPDNMAKRIRLVLINAIYFLGEWQEPFNEKDTERRDFTLSTGEVLKTEIMKSDEIARYAAVNADGSYFQTPYEIERGQTAGLYPGADGYAVLELPYKDCDLAMMIISPDSPDGLSDIESQLSLDKLLSLERYLRTREVQVLMPKFKLEHEYYLVPELKELGLVRAFDSTKADLSGISEITHNQRLYVSDVFQKAFLEVNEKGTEAAAATLVRINVTSSMRSDNRIPFIPTFRADRPFLFVIRDTKRGFLLFMGRVVNPKSSSSN